MKIQDERFKRTKWMMHDRFGMFIHWGLYSIPAKGEWIRSYNRISTEDYQEYFDSFNPKKFNATAWAKTAAKAGMKYAVFTAKHHDGFCLFDSALTDYKSTNTPAKRDFVKEFLDAFRAEGIKVGLYYSLIDWHHEDYPAYEDSIHPMRENPQYKDQGNHFENYIKYFHGQVKELITKYGKLDLLWFDYSYNDMTGEKWEATKLINMVRQHQPDIVLNNRLGGNICSTNPEIYSGDFHTPEQIIPPNGVCDENGEPVPWEECTTINDSWGYISNCSEYKSARDIIRILVECVSKGGNLLLNIGPDANGIIAPECVSILSEVGEWLKINGESIYGCGRANFPKPEWGRITQNEKSLYIHLLEPSLGTLFIKNAAGIGKYARLMLDGSKIEMTEPWNLKYLDSDNYLFLKKPFYHLPDPKDTVIEVKLK